MKENNNCFSSGLNVIDSAAPLNFLSDPEPINALVLSVPPTPEIGILPNGCSANVRISGLVVPERRISAPSSGGFATNTSPPTPVKENSICLSSGLKVADSAAPLNFLSEPDPVNGVVVESATSPLILITPDPKCCRLNNVYPSPLSLNSPPETAPIDVDSAAPENANRVPSPI